MKTLKERLKLEENAEYEALKVWWCYLGYGRAWGFIESDYNITWDVVRELAPTINSSTEWEEIFSALFFIYYEKLMNGLDTKRVMSCIKEIRPYWEKFGLEDAITPDNYVVIYNNIYNGIKNGTIINNVR